MSTQATTIQQTEAQASSARPSYTEHPPYTFTEAPAPLTTAKITTTTTTAAPVTSQGALYTRWGRTECGLVSDVLVYIGIVGGSRGGDSGAASNTLCLPRDPEWGNYDDTDNTGGLIYGTEYQTENFNPFLNGDPTDQNAPCAVCKSTVHGTALMLPAKHTCYTGWEKAYSGYLMSESSESHRTEYVCVDGAPEVNPAGSADEQSSHLYPVQGMCGSLPCPPYVNARELTCVVCLQ